MKKNILSTVQTCFCIAAGNAILAFLVAAFIIPHDIIMGGTTGIGIVLGSVLPIDTAVVILILNVVLLIAGWIILGRKFFITTVASSVLYPVFLGVMQRIPGIDSLTDNSLLAAVFAGSLMGLALGLVMRVGSSTGGMDVVALVLHKWLHLPVSVLVYASDIVVVGGQAIFSNAEKILLGIVVLVIESFVLEQVMVLGKAKIQLFVVSDHYEQIRLQLLKDLEAGVTMAIIETGFLEQRQKGVLCVIPSRKLFNATEMIRAVDPSAFITITKIKEVRGRGFTEERETLKPKEG